MKTPGGTWVEVADEAEVPTEPTWLTVRERETLRGLRVPKRRADWLRGRWAAKRAVARWAGLPMEAALLHRIEVRPASDGAPEAFVDDDAGPALSISHSGSAAIAAVAARGPMGCDIERLQPLARATVELFFTAGERERIRAEAGESARVRRTILTWSAKESALKALRSGLRADTRSVDARLGEAGPDGWGTVAVRNRGDGRMLRGWWRLHDTFVLTVVEPSADLVHPHRER